MGVHIKPIIKKLFFWLISQIQRTFMQNFLLRKLFKT